MPDRILVPVDGSPRSDDALEYALETFPDAEITAFHALQSGTGDLGVFSGTPGDLPDGDAEERTETVLESARDFAARYDATIDTETGRGRADRLIVSRADEGDYDLVVMGSHGRDGAARVLLGSVAERVARRSPTPVTIVR